MDYYLKFQDEAQANSVLEGIEASIDTLGIIYKPTGIMLQGEQGEYPEMAPIDGWHVNVRSVEEIPELEPYNTNPLTPMRVWA